MQSTLQCAVLISHYAAYGCSLYCLLKSEGKEGGGGGRERRGEGKGGKEGGGRERGGGRGEGEGGEGGGREGKRRREGKEGEVEGGKEGEGGEGGRGRERGGEGERRGGMDCTIQKWPHGVVILSVELKASAGGGCSFIEPVMYSRSTNEMVHQT